MSEQKIKEWKAAKQAVSSAKFWQNLPQGQSYSSGDSFEISIAHSKPPMLMRAGQQAAGGRNYWETDNLFNQAMLAYLVQNWSAHYPEIIKIMEQKERAALLACQTYVDEMQALISGAVE